MPCRKPSITCLLLGLALLATPAAADPNLTLATTNVHASGVTQSGDVLFLSVSRQDGDWMSQTTSGFDLVADADGDGQVDLSLTDPLSRRGVWAAVDCDAGTFDIEMPAGFQTDPMTVDQDDLFVTTQTFRIERQGLELVVVRPGVGAWHGRLFDGAAGDEGLDSDGAVETALTSLATVWTGPSGGLPSLSAIEIGDLVIGIDPLRLDYFVLVVEKKA